MSARKTDHLLAHAATPRLNRYIPHRPTPKQAAFLLCLNEEVFFGGAAAGGKSDALLMAALQYVDVPGYAALLLRRTFRELALDGALMHRSHQWLDATDARWNEQDHRWTFRSGATLTFGHMEDSGAHLQYQSAEFQYIGFDELTAFTEGDYRFMFSRLRRREGSTVPLRMRAASNPNGPGRDWVYRRFVAEEGTDDCVFIPARVEDNPHVDAEAYDRSLRNLGPIAYQQLRNGDWTVRQEGGLFRAEWFDHRMIAVRELPARLRLCRFWDLAATEAAKAADPDHTAGVLLGLSEGQWYVLEVARTRSSPLVVEKLIASTAERDAAWAKESGRQLPAIRMETEPGSAGITVIDHYRRNVLRPYDFAGVRSTGSKETRAQPVAARCEAGDFWICSGRWNTPFLDELAAFPMGGHDDQVDALAGAYAFLASFTEVPIVAPIGIWRESPWRIY